MSTLGELLRRAARRYPERVAVSSDGASLTYAALDRRVDGVAATLYRRGIHPGDAVATILPNGPDLLLYWLALARLGAVYVPVNPALTATERDGVIRHSGARLVLERPPAQEDGQPPKTRVRPDDPAAVLYTSGSTGTPKGCRVSHLTYTLPAPSFVDRLGIDADDTLLACLPLFHMAGQSFAVSALQAGAELAVVERFSVTRFWQQAARTGATVFRYLGEMLTLLLDQHDGVPEHRLRLVYGGGATPEVAAAFTARFGAPVLTGYGLSETNTVLCATPGKHHAGNLGTPLPHVAVRIAEPSGEIQIGRNPAMLLEYQNDPERTAAAFDGDWFRTGDLGRLHADGSVEFVARRSDLIRRKGEHVDPREVEEVLAGHRDVAHAAVVAVPVSACDDAIEAYVVPATARRPHLADLRAWCARYLAAFKRPRGITVVDRMPMTATSKVDRLRLRRQSIGVLE